MRMYISEGQAIDILADQFGLEAPVAFETVKKKYRLLSKQTHPDLGGSEEAFKELNNAFEELKKLFDAGSSLFDAEAESTESGEGNNEKHLKMPRTLVDGTPLSELGLGLGPTTNGRDCPHCAHKGYTATYQHDMVACMACTGRGRVRRQWCNECAGRGRVRSPNPVSVYLLRCYSCKGTGEIEILNPVLPKGRLTSLSMQQPRRPG